MGMLCTLDLFPVPESTLHDRYGGSSHAITDMDYFMQSQSLSFFPLYPYSTGTFDHPRVPQLPLPVPRRQSMISYLTPESELGDVVYRLDNHLVTESSKVTPAVVGEKCVEPILMDYMDKKCLFFIFSVSSLLPCPTCFSFLIQDLAVQREGTFIFRYRVFDIFSSATCTAAEHPILAEVFGGVFKVYSTRAFPGLAPSTEFTKVGLYGGSPVYTYRFYMLTLEPAKVRCSCHHARLGKKGHSKQAAVISRCPVSQAK